MMVSFHRILQVYSEDKGFFGAVGMFSIFEALVQDRLGCSNGLKEAAEILNSKGDENIKERFSNLRLAINVLKHGKGESYRKLLNRSTALPFKIKQPNENFFNEGDVSEVSTLIEVDDDFVMNCAKTIRDVSDVIHRARPKFIA